MVFVEFLIDRWKIIGLLIVLLIILQVFSGKVKWQYYPLYILVFFYLFIISLNYFNMLGLSPRLGKWILVIGFSLIIITILLLLVFPSGKLPNPSGKFKIGTRTYDLEDKTRQEIYTEIQGDNRKIKYQIWYPARDIKRYGKAKWIFDGLGLSRQLAKSMHLPSFMLDHTVKIDSNSYLDAPLNGDQKEYPMVIISHGWKSFREIHTDFGEELASNGFIAISIDHTFGSQAVKFKDGSTSYLNEEALTRPVNPSESNSNSNTLVNTFGQDVKSVLDDLEKINKEDPDFKGRLDLEKIGVLGHSTGGGGQVYISLEDKRIKSLMGLDAWVGPINTESLKKGLTIPSLFLRSEQWSRGPNNTALDQLIRNSDWERMSLIDMDKTNHIDFTMSYMYSPLSKYIGFTGALGGRKSSRIQRQLILEFFNKTLKTDEIYNNSFLEDIVDKYDALSLRETH